MQMPAQWREARRRTRRPAKMRERQREGGPRSWADGEATRTRAAAAAQALTNGRWGGEPRVCVYQVFPCVKNGAYPASIPCLTAGKWRGMPGAAIPSPGETLDPVAGSA